MNTMASLPKNWYERNWRWFVLATLFFATFLNYFDRQTLGAAMSPISNEFGLDNIQVGDLLSAFLLTYAISHLFVGIIIDRIKNIRIFFPIMVIGWSLTTIFSGLAKTYTTLLWMRYLLGIWESVNFPICLMIIARIFPAKERSLASGIFSSGAFLATLLAPKIVIYFASYYTWRYSFILAGAIGFVWLLPWLLIFRKPEKRAERWVSVSETSKKSGDTLSLKNITEILRSPAFWGVALIGIGIIPSLYFCTQWLPFFLEKSLDVTYDQRLGNYLMIIYLMQDAGLWIGGAIVLWLAKRGMKVLNSRKVVITGGYIFMITVSLLPLISSVGLKVFIFCLFTFGIGVFLGNQHAFKQDVMPKQVGTIAAWVGFTEMIFTTYVIKRVGIITNETLDFTPVFLFLAGLATFALIIVFTLLRPKWLDIK